MKREPTVLVAQEPWTANADVSSLQRYGAPHMLLKRHEFPSSAPFPSYLKLLTQLRDRFDPHHDYLTALPADPLGVLLVGIALERLNIPAVGFNWLRYDRERSLTGDRRKGVGFYVPTSIRLSPGVGNDRPSEKLHDRG